ncbi:putative head-closure protein [Vibrio phage 242E40-1]|nr:putative head-closure protein [Vibrio phage 242E40-1]
MGLDLSGVANKLLLKLCDSTDYSIIYSTGDIEDPDTGQVTPGVEVVEQLDSALEDTASFGLVDGSNVRTGDIFLMIPPKVTLPSDPFIVSVRGKRYTVEANMPFVNGGVLQYTELQLRSS